VKLLQADVRRKIRVVEPDLLQKSPIQPLSPLVLSKPKKSLDHGRSAHSLFSLNFAPTG
jgi:hypothetical protein